MLVNFDMDSVLVLKNGVIPNMETEKAKNLLLDKTERLINTFDTDIKPAIRELLEGLNISNLSNNIAINSNIKIKTKDMRDLYKLKPYSIFSSGITDLIDKIVEKGLDSVSSATVRNILYDYNNIANTYSEIFVTNDDLFKYIHFLRYLEGKELVNCKKTDSINSILMNLANIVLYIYISSELYYVISTLNNGLQPITGLEAFYIKKRKMNNMICNLSMEAYEDDDDSDWDDDDDEEEENSDGNDDAKGKILETAEDIDKKVNPDDSESEANEKNIIQKMRSLFGKVKEKIVSVPQKVSLLCKKIRLFLKDRKHIAFYKRYRGKFQGLWEQYAQEVTHEENKMRGDPIIILKEQATDYIIQLGKNLCELAEEVQKLSNEIENTESYDKKVQLAKEFGKDAPARDENGKDIGEDRLGKRIYLATKRKMAKILLSGEFKIYGFTEESMTVGKLPPPNHLIVSIFVEDPFRTPEEQPITDIFDSWESFNILADADKQQLFAVQDLSNAVLKNSITADTFRKIETNRKKMYNGLKETAPTIDKKELKRRKKIIKNINNGLNESVKAMGNMKLYMMDCINVYFSMIMRIDNLAFTCIKKLVDIETQKVDRRYNSKMGAGQARTTIDEVRHGFQEHTKI